MQKRRLIAAIACRNESTRLYAKPMQFLNIEKKISVIEFIINRLKKIKVIDEIVLAISNEMDSLIYYNIAKKHKIKFIFGDKKDVLFRLIKAGKKNNATDIFRVTSESPFTYLEDLNQNWKKHIKGNYDATFLDNIIDGCGYEIIKLKSLVQSHSHGESKHRSELCSLYIRENKDKYNILKILPPKHLFRYDLRLTIDYPEDLIVCLEIYKICYKNSRVNFYKIVNFFKKNEYLKKLIRKYTIAGYQSMYL